MGFDLKRFEILIEPKEYYKNGDRVNCILIMELNGRLKSKYMFITAIGELFANFYPQHENFKKVHFMTIPFSLCDLIRCDVITTGVYRIRFDFYLINAILPSLKNKNGHVTYFIEAMIEPNIFSDSKYNTRAEIKVKCRSNVWPPLSYNAPIASNREILIRIFGLKVGTVRLSAHLDKMIFNSSDTIYMNFHLNNRSTKMIRFLPQLVQSIVFKDEYLVLESRKLMASNYAEVCPENSSQSDVIGIQIPFDCFSTIKVNFLEIDYSIKLYVDISGGAEYFDSIPIFIK